METARPQELAFRTDADRLRVMADIESEDAASPPVERKAEISLTHSALMTQLFLARRHAIELVNDQAAGRITHESFLAEGRHNSEALRELTMALARLNAKANAS
jgi:hypothetical protein